MRLLIIQENGIQESIGVSNIAAMAKAHGHECDVMLLSHEEDFLESVRSYDPGIIGFSALTGVHNHIFKIASYIKKHMDVPIIVGGPHTTHFPECIEKDCVDIIARSEAEYPILELLENMEQGKDYTQIPNLWVKWNGKVFENDVRPPVVLDELPPPDREIYYKYDFLRDMPIKRFIAQMGCPYPCTFCHEPNINRMYRGKGTFIRRKSPQVIVDEIKYIKERYPLKHVHFSDDIFYMRYQYEWLEEFVELYKREIGLPWTCSIRFDSIDERSADKFAECGCTGVQIGLETGNEFLREKVIRKKVTNEAIYEGAKMMRERGIKMLTTNMIGLPGETLDQAFETVAVNAKIKTHFARANTFMAFPRVDMIGYAMEHGFISSNYNLDDYVAEPQEIALKTKYANEFKNICALFWLFVKCPTSWIPLFRRVVKLPDNALFRFLGALNMVQEVRFFHVGPIAGWRFFKNTVLMDNVSGASSTLQWIPRLRRAQKSATRKAIESESSKIYEAERGIF